MILLVIAALAERARLKLNLATWNRMIKRGLGLLLIGLAIYCSLQKASRPVIAGTKPFDQLI